MHLDCRALLFDLDGVLVDSATCVEGIWQQWAALHRLDAAAVVRASYGRRTIEAVRLVASHLDAEAEAAALAATESRQTDGVHEVPGARALVRPLPPRSWAVVTSGLRAVAEHRLRYTGLPLPAVMVCADDVARGKPDPECYLSAASRLGVPAADCLVVEDAPAGLEAARAAGMRALALTTTHRAHELRGATVVADTLRAIRVDRRRGALRVTVRAAG